MQSLYTKSEVARNLAFQSLYSKGEVLKNIAKNTVNSKTNIAATPRDFETFIPKRKDPSNSHQNDEGKENGLSTTPFLSRKN